MAELGYIVTKNKIKNILPFIKVVANIELIDDITKPILIIGLEEAKKYTSSFSILNKEIKKNMFWTFGKREKRVDFEKDIEKFQEYVLKYALEQLKYYYVNILTIKYEKMKHLLKIINNCDKKFIFIDKKMFYLYYNNYILGVSSDILSYIGIKKYKVVELLEKNKQNIIFFNDFSINHKIKKIIDTKRYVIPYFLSLNEEK